MAVEAVGEPWQLDEPQSTLLRRVDWLHVAPLLRGDFDAAARQTAGVVRIESEARDPPRGGDLHPETAAVPETGDRQLLERGRDQDAGADEPGCRPRGPVQLKMSFTRPKRSFSFSPAAGRAGSSASRSC